MSVSKKYEGWLASGFYNGLKNFSTPLFGLLSTMLLARRALTVEENGVWGLFLTVTAFIDTIRQGLIKNSLVKFINYSESHEHTDVLSAAFYLNAVITIVIAVLLFFFNVQIATWLKMPGLAPMMHTYEIGLLLLIPFMHFESIIYGKLLYKGLFWTYLVRQGVPLLLIAILYYSNNHITLNLLVWLFNLGILFSAIVAYFTVKSSLSHSLVYSKKWVSKIWHFGKFAFGTGLSNMAFRNADQFLLSSILGNKILNAYQNMALRIINLADTPSQVLADILFPKSSKSDTSNNPERIKYYYEKTVGATLSFVLPAVIFIILFPKLFLAVLCGSKYYGAAPYLQLASISVVFLAFIKYYGVIIDSTGKPAVNCLTTTIIALIQIGLCIFFIKNFALMGAAYALLITHVIGFIMTQYILRRSFNINFLNCFKYAFDFYPELFKIVLEKIGFKPKLVKQHATEE
ncbi:oligosaccharide flippase family protein [Ferruginibacter albus]|uniref:oligosaccharide flippase family protein n=1 Tax=Ferruginibacter albus TaxID=2875540 RepID=UPI001CC64ED2|nr:oligosaccharide flippase family protein [Ferruginibacter albus]UAY51326.1 oligosaccharide flippase family protein [Ferruginibacter albus]